MKRFTRKRALVCSAAAFVAAVVVFAVTLVINNFGASATKQGDSVVITHSGDISDWSQYYYLTNHFGAKIDGLPNNAWDGKSTIAWCGDAKSHTPVQNTTDNKLNIINIDKNTSDTYKTYKNLFKIMYYGHTVNKDGLNDNQRDLAIHFAINRALNGTWHNKYSSTEAVKLYNYALSQNLPEGIENMKVYEINPNNNYYQRIYAYSFTVKPTDETFNLSVVKQWNDTDTTTDLYDTFNNNSVTNIVPHSVNLRIGATVNVTFNGTTKTLRAFILNSAQGFSASESDISCHQVKSNLFNVTDDYTCNGLSLSTTETIINHLYEGTFSSTITPQSANVTNGGTVDFTINNKFYTTYVNAKKTWNDKGGERPSYVTFDVKYRLANSTSDNWALFKRYEKLPISGNSPEHFTFMNLPAFLKINGKFELVEYKAFEYALYDASENDVTSLYEKTEDTITFADLTSGNKVVGRTTTQALTNTDLISLPVEKIWVGDEDYPEDRPEYIVVNLMCGDDAVFDDQGNPIELTLDASNNWRGEFTGLVRDGCDDQSGYYASEGSVPANYKAIEVEEDGTWKLRNYHGIDVKVKKKWIGDDPDVQSLSVDLVCSDDKSKVVASATLNAANNWEYSWTNRYYNECGNHKYYVFERNYSGSFTPSGTVTDWDDVNKTWVLELNNVKTIDIPVEKAWAGRSSDVNDMKFDVKVVLLCEDNSGNMNPYMYDANTRAELTLNATNDWGGTFTNILGGDCRSFGIAEESTDGSTLYQDGDTYTKSTVTRDFKIKVHYTGDAANGFTVTNEELIDISAWKSWDDEGDGVDTDRPEQVMAFLMCVNGDSRSLAPIKPEDGSAAHYLNEDNEYSTSWENLSTSECESYEVVEELPSSHGYGNNYYYQSTVTGDETNGYQITNTKYVDISVAKVWNYRNPNNIPNSVDIVLTCNDTDVANTQVTLTKAANMLPDGTWFYRYTGLKASDCPSLTGSHHGYSVREIIPQDAIYNATVSTAQDGTVIIRNTEEFNIPVEKVWDSNRSDDDLPDEVEVSLFCGPYSVDTITLRKSEGWRGEFGPLTKDSCAEPDRYEFFVVEDTEIPGFKATIDGNAEEGFTITNTEYTHLEVHKTWSKRNTTQTPSSLELQLVCKDGNTANIIGDPVVITAADNSTYDFTNLKTSDCSNYDVDEHLRYYAYEYEEKNHSLIDPTRVDLTNKEMIYVPVEKVWNVGEDTETPDEIEVSLYCGATDDENNFRQTIKLEKWLNYYDQFGPFEYDECAAGYNVTEDTNLDGFESVITANDDGSFTITNTEHSDLSVSKQWEVTPGKQVDLPSSITVALWCETTDTEVANKRIRLNRPNYQGGWNNLSVDDCAEYGVREVAADGTTILSTVGDRYNDFFFYGGIEGSAAKGFTIKNTYDGVNISGTKTWNFTDEYGNTQSVSNRPVEIAVSLKQNGTVIDTVTVRADAQGNWDYSFDDQPKYDAQGNEYTYTVDEAEIAHYVKTINGYNITNQYKPDYTTVTAAKDWATLKDAELPSQVEVRLYCGETDLNQPKYITKASNWATVSWTNLDVQECEAGYEVREILPEGSEFVSTRVGSNGKYTFTNAETVEIPVRKSWVKRNTTALPESVTVALYCEVNNSKNKLDEQTLSAANNWTYTWTERNVETDNCRGGAYTVDEISTVPNFQKTSVSYTTANGYVIENTELTSQKVIKVWEGDTAQDRPGSITADLLCGDTIKKTVTLSEANNPDGDNTWEYTWDNLLVSDCAQGYSVRETYNIPNYKSSSKTLEDGTVVITNRRTTSVSVIKEWKNDDKTKRPGYIEASLMCGDTTIETVKLSEENNLDGDDTWEYTWDDLLVSDCEQGYTVDENINIPNYHKTVKQLEDGTFLITNEFDNPDTSDKKFGLGGIIGISSAVVLLAGAFAARKFIGRR